ncbi:hypothetical protein MiSe_10270 [Microseira wollei NIES-4236]|uniref:Uncharacterized protein n=1 Tax=Microseira wollei NIES-4236 TaxID=2530354 RepID=A0AAV3WF60_9CYAN|nr:hypothetical protein MiSe_10270 [Microseira wollei NIES-4236]
MPYREVWKPTLTARAKVYEDVTSTCPTVGACGIRGVMPADLVLVHLSGLKLLASDFNHWLAGGLAG